VASVEVNETVNASIDRVWPLVADFAGVDKLMTTISSIEGKGEGVGMERHIRSDGMEGVIVERLETLDPSAHQLSYSITEETVAPLPFKSGHYLATVKMSETAGVTAINWRGEFEPNGVPEGQSERFAGALYRAMIKAIRRELGVE